MLDYSSGFHLFHCVESLTTDPTLKFNNIEHLINSRPGVVGQELQINLMEEKKASSLCMLKNFFGNFFLKMVQKMTFSGSEHRTED